MAENREPVPPGKRKNGPGRPFQRGGPSPNPGGFSKEARAARALIKEKLDKAFTTDENGEPLPDGRDRLVEATVRGAEQGDGTCLKISWEYRFGKPPTEIDANVVADVQAAVASQIELGNLSREDLATLRLLLAKTTKK